MNSEVNIDESAVEIVRDEGTSKNALWRQNRGIGRYAALGLSVSIALERLV